MPEDDEKKIKTAKTFKRGKGIEEQVLYDDAFDWDSLFDEPITPSDERKAELDEFDLEKTIESRWEEKPKSFPSESAPPKVVLPSQEKPVSPAPSRVRRRFPFRASTLLLLVLLVLGLTSMGIYSLRSLLGKESSNALNVVTASIPSEAEANIQLDPFVVPAPHKGRNQFVRIQVHLLINSRHGEELAANMPMIRKAIFEELTLAWEHRVPRVRTPDLIDAINRSLNAPCVIDLAWTTL